MSIYTTKLNAKDANGTVKQINIYSTTTEATTNYPVAGIPWECKVGGSTGYISLYPVANVSTSGHNTNLDAFLTVKKGGVDYRLQTAADRRHYITITNVSGQTIVNGSNTAISSQYVTKGGSLTFNLTPATGHNKGTLKVDGNVVTLPYTLSNITAAHTITATDGGLIDCNVTITQPTGGTITVTAGGTAHTSSFSVKYGTTYTASIATTATSGTHSCYKTGTLSPAASGTITGAVTFSHNPNPLAKNTVTLSQSAVSYGTYTMTVNGTARAATAAATSLSVNCGSTYAITYNPPSNTDQYSYTNPGNIATTTIHSNTSNTKNITRSTNLYKVTFPATSNQKYSVAFSKSSSYIDGTVPSNLGEGNTQREVSVPLGTSWTITYSSPSTGYNVGATKTNTKTAASAYTETHNAATLKTYTFTVTMASSGIEQKVTVVGSKAGTKTFTSSGSFTVTHGETWTASIALTNTSQGAVGTLNATSGTVSGAYTLTATSAYGKIVRFYNNDWWYSHATMTANLVTKCCNAIASGGSGTQLSNTGSASATNGIPKIEYCYNGTTARVYAGTATGNNYIYQSAGTTRALALATAIAGKTVYPCNNQTSSSNWYSCVSYQKSDGTWAYDVCVPVTGLAIPAGIKDVRFGCWIKSGFVATGTYTDLICAVYCPTMTAVTMTHSGTSSYYWAGVYGDTVTPNHSAVTGFNLGTLNRTAGTAITLTGDISVVHTTPNWPVYNTLSVGAATNQKYNVTFTKNSSYQNDNIITDGDGVFSGVVPTSGSTDFKSWANIVTPSAGQVYTCSFEAYGTVNGCKLTTYLYNNNTGLQVSWTRGSQTQSSTNADGNTVHTLTTGWAKYAVSWYFNAGTTGTKLAKTLLFRLISGTNNGATVYIRNVKLENADRYVTGFVPKNVTNQTVATSYTLPYGVTAAVTYTANTGYTKSADASKTMTSAQSVGAASATLITKTVTLPAITTGIASYTIKVTLNTTYSSTMPTCKSSDGATTLTLTNGTAVTATGGKSYVLTNVPYGATVLQTWTASTDYELSKTTQSETIANGTASTFTNPTATAKYPVYFTNTPYATVTVKNGSTAITSGTKVLSGTTLTYDVTYATGYESNGVSTGDYLFTINQSAGQTITVTTGGVAHTQSFAINKNAAWTASIVADSGCIAGTLNATSGNATGNITLSATPAKATIYIDQNYNCDIQLRTGSASGTVVFTAPKGYQRVSYNGNYGTTYYVTYSNLTSETSFKNFYVYDSDPDDYSYGSCFVAGTKIICVADDGLYYEQNIETIPQGTKILGANGVINTLIAIDKAKLGTNRKMISIDVNGRTLKCTPEHKLWVRKNTEYWGIFDKQSQINENTVRENGKTGVDITYEKALEEYNVPLSWLEPENPEQTAITKAIPCIELDKNGEAEYGTVNGWKTGKSVEIDDYPPETEVYHLLVDGNRTYFADTVLSSSRAYAADIDWLNYVEIKNLIKDK